jgi:hypothetical protein
MDQMSYQCKKCSNIYKVASSLRRHERECGVEPSLHCAICGYSCFRNYQLRNHILSHHPNQLWTNFMKIKFIKKIKKWRNFLIVNVFIWLLKYFLVLLILTRIFSSLQMMSKRRKRTNLSSSKFTSVQDASRPTTIERISWDTWRTNVELSRKSFASTALMSHDISIHLSFTYSHSTKMKLNLL